MRVIAGEYKGRPLRAVSGMTTRPTTDKIKEAVFQVLGPFFEGGHVLDLFAGSGALGIEALSRGMTEGIFVDRHPKAIETIYENIKTLKLDENVEVFRTDAKRALKAAGKRDLQFRLILLDPPYGKFNYQDMIEDILSFQLLETGGYIYCEHEAKEHLPDELEGLELFKKDVYGSTTAVTIYIKK